jgi:SAM-dependent methyltransferase
MSGVTQVSAPADACRDEAVRQRTEPRRPPFRFSDIWKAPITDLPIRDEIIYQYLLLADDKDVLEIGPGSGFSAFRLSRLVRRLTLLDVAAENIERLQGRLGDIPNMEFVAADICSPDATKAFDRAFDVIEAVEVFEFLPHPRIALQNMGRLLRPGGLLFLQFPNYEPGRSPGVTYFRRASELSVLLREGGFENSEVYALHLRPYADFLFRNFHEKPLNFYRRLKGRTRPDRPQTFDQVWFFRNHGQFEKYRPIFYLAWAGFMGAMRLGGQCFGRVRLDDEILNHNLLVIASRTGDGETNAR